MALLAARGGRVEKREEVGQAASADAAAAATHLLHLPRPGRRGSGLPSPVLKLAWQRRQTYIFELDIMGLTPGSPAGRAATYSACVWRSFWTGVAAGVTGAGVAGRRVGMGGSGMGAEEGPHRGVGPRRGRLLSRICGRLCRHLREA